jgi:hypothetical protein
MHASKKPAKTRRMASKSKPAKKPANTTTKG